MARLAVGDAMAISTLAAARSAAPVVSSQPVTNTTNATSQPAFALSQPASASSQPASEPFACSVTSVIRLAIEGRQEPALCWIHRPIGYAQGQRPPLIVCLHGTDDTAEEMIAFWQARRMQIPAVLVAPQGIGKGWSSDDVATIHALFDYLPSHVWYDSNRVLLVGFSAGGSMTFQMIYDEKVPVTAAACLANYVPPRLSLDEIRERRQLPVFYAVGTKDMNGDLMRAGSEFLQTAGANIEIHRPPIGHELNAEVAQAALDWFFQQCDRQIRTQIEQANRVREIGPIVERLEQIVSQPTWFEASQISAATQALSTLNQPGEASLHSAERLILANRTGEAIRLLQEIELKYGTSRLGTTARTRKEALGITPILAMQMPSSSPLPETNRQRELKADREYERVQKLLSQRRFDDAADVCQELIINYGDTPAAERAQRMLKKIENRRFP